MEILDIALLLGAGFLGGGVNAIAGGATFFTFPAMMAAGLSPVAANASNTVALAPASFTAFLAMRSHLPRSLRLLVPFLTLGLAGGAFGAWLVLWLGDARFRAAVPWLLLFATAMFAAGPHLMRMMHAARSGAHRTLMRGMGLVVQSLTGVYGGFFGAGMGMVMLACLSLLGFQDLRSMNALKNLFTSITNGVAIVVFVINGAVSWSHAFVMMAAAVLGGFVGGQLGNRLPQTLARRLIIGIGGALTAAYFIRG